MPHHIDLFDILLISGFCIQMYGGRGRTILCGLVLGNVFLVSNFGILAMLVVIVATLSWIIHAIYGGP